MNSKISRRDFLRASTTGVAVVGASAATAESISHPPGHRGNERVELIAPTARCASGDAEF